MKLPIQYNTTDYALNDMPMGENKDSDDDTCPLAPRFTSSSPNFAKGQDEQKGHATSENTDTLFVYISSVHVASEAAFRISWYSYNADAQSSSRADPTTGPEKALTGAEYLTNISTRCRRLLWDSISKRPSNVATGTKSPSLGTARLSLKRLLGLKADHKAVFAFVRDTNRLPRYVL
ncbi:hypothetical protein B0H13DRAFT_2302536 [Mycena leptocephala]|nr:hypothetical protein B0H13DRAFT_2302536 [Mycena leptocephala]